MIPYECSVQEPALMPVLPTHSNVQYLIRNEVFFKSKYSVKLNINVYSFFLLLKHQTC